MPGKSRFILSLVLAVLALSTRTVHAAEPLDGFEDLSAWKVITADGVQLKLSAEPGQTGGGARLDYDFTRGSGYAIIRKEFALDLPPNYRFSFALRAQGPRNTLEFKLIDPSGDNVWWVNQRDLAFPHHWQTMTLPRRRFSFAWGPSGGAPLTKAQYIEIVVTSSSGGSGTLWLDDLRFEPLPEVREYTGTPVLRTSAAADPRPLGPDGRAEIALECSGNAPALSIEFGQTRELGGIVLDWGAATPPDYDILASLDSTTFTAIARVRDSNGGRDYIPLPDAAARALAVQFLPSNTARPTITLRSARFLPPDFADATNNLLSLVAKDSPRGRYPRYFAGEATYWTIVGAPGDEHEALINEEGAVEVDKLGFSVEPFIFTGRKLFTWHDSTNTQSLADGCLPIPTVHRVLPGLSLDVTAFAEGPPGRSSLLLRYQLTNTGEVPSDGTLYLALRPMQVNPPYQHLNITGGAASVTDIRLDGGAVRLDNRALFPFLPPDAFGATTFDSGEVSEYLAADTLPARADVSDARALASAALAYRFSLAPGASRIVGIRVPFPSSTSTPTQSAFAPVASVAELDSSLESARAFWHERLDRVRIRLPRGQEHITDSIRANLAYILINRDGPGIQPGSRSYERTWIRDGALTSTALLSMGLEEYVVEFLDWFAPFQYDSGKIPCCVDRRGPDPVPEHDSHGQYIYAVHTCFAHTADVTFLKRHYPHVIRAVDYIESLRGQRMTDEYAQATDDRRILYGLMPESISHEGYSAKPMHSYWDDLWTLKGLADAASLAHAMNDPPRAARFLALHESFRQTLLASLQLAMSTKGIDYLPGCAELGDFDATSTTVGLFPCGQLDSLPQPQLSTTFDRYWSYFKGRRDGTVAWKDYTPYEHRIVGSLILLDQRDRALEVLDFFFRDQRPPRWRHWAEVVRRDPREPWFIGDMPHTWVGSDFINSVRLMLAYTRESDAALILGAGLPRTWLETPEGIDVKGLRTEFGALAFTTRSSAGLIRIEVESLPHSPPGGVHFALPAPKLIDELSLNGAKIPVPSDGKVRLPALPAVLEARYSSTGE